MRQRHYFFGPVPLAIASCALLAACSHRTVNPPGGSSGGPGSSGSANAGSSGANPGAGGTSSSGGTPGAGNGNGGSTPGGGTAGTAGSTGTAGQVAGGGTAGVGGQSTTKTSCTDTAYTDKYYKPYAGADDATRAKITALMGSMSNTEKADQMRGNATRSGQNYDDIFDTPDNTTKGISGFKFRDGPRGVNLAAQLPAGKTGYVTSFPAPMARGAAFDLDLEYRIGQAHGDEMIASGNTMMLAPTVNVLRHPLWGRAQETYGEDPYQLGRIGTAYVVGVQEYVPACVKHYAGNNVELDRETMNADMDDQTLREMYAKHFGMVIRDAGVACVMAAYNKLQGLKCTQNKELLTDVLRTEFGFKGFILTDWWAMPPGQSATTSADTLKQNAQQAIAAGLDMELPWTLNYSQLESLIGTGVTQAQLDASVARILEQKFRFKVDKINGPYGLKAATTTFSGSAAIENNQAHIDLALEAAVKGSVLLKNENNTLPISRDKVKTIAVLGAKVSYTVVNTDNLNGTIDFARDVRTGDLGSSRVFHDPAKAMGPFAGIQAAAGTGITVVAGDTAAAAANADFIVVVGGLTPQDEGEEYTQAGDRPNGLLDAKQAGKPQNDLIAAAAALGKPMVVVLEGGSVIEMPWLASVPAVVMAWYPGMVGGKAIGQLLFGTKNFSGKTPITWPKAQADLPPLSGGATTKMDYFLGYRYYDNKAITPLYAFGHGLSYTKFEYSNLQVPCSDVTPGGIINVKVNIKNTGTVAGDEIAFLFVSYPGTTIRRPAKELKGFQRVSLEPGAAQDVTIPVRVEDLKYYDETAKAWKATQGTVNILVGPNAATLPLMDSVVLK